MKPPDNASTPPEAPSSPAARAATLGGLSAPIASVLREQTQAEISKLRGIITSLSRELELAHEDNRQLKRERDQLNHQLMQLDVLKLSLQNADLRWQESQQDREDLRRAQQAVVEQNRTLRERCDRLIDALKRSRAEREADQQEIACLAEQVEQLRAMVDFLTAQSS